ncbi:hypothetical protein [Mycobacteroides abscessus]|uniref:hypothetical protein n=1 Tax=Mycobacteroides abscessus TaxID=36809 RepID=UPI0009A7232E|nr:hypothetical protein [Mycobacteroides abscessus]
MTDEDTTITVIPAPPGLTVINVGEVYPIAALRVKQTADSVEVTPMILYPGKNFLIAVPEDMAVYGMSADWTPKSTDKQLPGIH